MKIDQMEYFNDPAFIRRDFCAAIVATCRLPAPGQGQTESLMQAAEDLIIREARMLHAASSCAAGQPAEPEETLRALPDSKIALAAFVTVAAGVTKPGQPQEPAIARAHALHAYAEYANTPFEQHHMGSLARTPEARHWINYVRNNIRNHLA